MQTANRSVATIRKDGNHLKDAASHYLQMHAHNPVDWFLWGEEALRRAQNEDKPIFLSIGYSSCHWCHVMEQETFEDDSVAAFLNEHFVSIKVDREERPDLDATYMEAVQAISGSGGWPMSVFVTPNRAPFFGGTYFPRDHFLALIRQIAELWRSDRAKIDSQSKQIAGVLAEISYADSGGSIRTSDIAACAEQIVQNSDPAWGGDRSVRKFPMPVTWNFLLHYARKTGDRKAGEAVRKTLDMMASGGIHDHVGGGFHRYTVDSMWVVPHFEKMLYDNAQVASLYAEAFATYKDEAYGFVARDVLDFLTRDMLNAHGGFFSSFDADAEGEEGSFYVWTPAEISQVAGATDGPILARLLGVTTQGNFGGRSVLTRRADPATAAKDAGQTTSDIAGLFDKHKPALREFRSRRPAPHLDRKIITAWNGLTISALAQGYRLFGEERYRVAAETTATYLWANHHGNDGSLLRSSTDAQPGGEGVLDDYAFLAKGLLDLYVATGNADYVRQTGELIRYVDAHFRSSSGGSFLTPDSADAPLRRRMELQDGVEPSGNSGMLHVLLMLASVTGDTKLEQKARSMINAFARPMTAARAGMAGWFDAALMVDGPVYNVIIAGEIGTPGMDSLVATARQGLPPFATMITIPPVGVPPDIVKLLPPLADKIALDGKATAYVCKYGTCDLPTSDPTILRRQLSGEWAN